MTNVPAKSRVVVGFPDYRVSSDGKIWSCLTQGIQVQRSQFAAKWRLRSLWVNRGGYEQVRLRRRNGKEVTTLVHRIVLLTFIGPCPQGQEARHLDGRPSNNNLENLEWASRQANMADRVAHGTLAQGEGHGMSKLSASQAREIFKRVKAGELQTVLAREFDVCQATVSSIKRGRCWAHLTEIS